MSPKRYAGAALALYTLFVVSLFGIGQHLDRARSVSAGRHSDVNTCIASNRTHDGVVKLAKQWHDQEASLNVPKALKRHTERVLNQLLGDFPALDCQANPIAFR